VADQTCATTSTGWDSLAGGDGHTNITGLTFTIDPASGASPNFLQRRLIIAISGASAKNTALKVSLTRSVRLRNDQFIEE